MFKKMKTYLNYNYNRLYDLYKNLRHKIFFLKEYCVYIALRIPKDLEITIGGIYKYNICKIRNIIKKIQNLRSKIKYIKIKYPKRTRFESDKNIFCLDRNGKRNIDIYEIVEFKNIFEITFEISLRNNIINFQIECNLDYNYITSTIYISKKNKIYIFERTFYQYYKIDTIDEEIKGMLKSIDRIMKLSKFTIKNQLYIEYLNFIFHKKQFELCCYTILSKYGKKKVANIDV